MIHRDTTLLSDPITEEIRNTRHRLAAQFENDVTRIGTELRRRQAESGRRIVRLSKRSPNQRPRARPLNPTG